MAGARLVVSDRGDILSPKYAPDIMAPAVIPAGTPSPLPIPISATPMVPTVDQELPVAVAITAQIRQLASRKTDGDKIFSP